jgi:hypothetical protein
VRVKRDKTPEELKAASRAIEALHTINSDKSGIGEVRGQFVGPDESHDGFVYVGVSARVPVDNIEQALELANRWMPKPR